MKKKCKKIQIFKLKKIYIKKKSLQYANAIKIRNTPGKLNRL